MKRYLLLYLAFVAYLSLYPWRFVPATSFGLGLTLLRTPGDLMDALANVLFYIPAGLTLAWSLRRPVLPAVLPAALLGGLFSLAIEIAQLWVPGRNSNWRDVFCNALGAALGAWAAGFVPAQLPPPHRRHWPPVALLFAVAWIGWHGFPLIPVLRRGPLAAAFNALLHPQPISWMETGDLLAGALVLTCCLSPHTGLLLLALAILPLQGILLHRELSLFRLAAGLAGAAAGLLRPPRPTTLAVLLCVWLGWRELYPFHFQPDPQPFTWLPMEGFFSTSREFYYRVILGKFFLYLGTTWALLRAYPHHWWSGWTCGALLALGEFLQRYMPGRTPESTDLLLAGLALMFLKILDRPRPVTGAA